MVGGDGLAAEHIDACAGDLAVAQRRDQLILLDDGSAGGVDEESVLFHFAEKVRTDHALRGFVEMQVQGDDVAFRGDLVHRLERDAERRDLLLREERVIGDHVHAEGLRLLDRAAGDSAAADRAERASSEPVHGLGHGEVPYAALDRVHELIELFGHGEHEQNGVRRHILDAVVRHVARRDAEIPGGVHVDRIHADAAMHEQTTFGKRGKDIARDLGKVYLDGVRVFARLDNLLRRFALAGAELEVRRLVNVDERLDRFIRIVRQHDERSFFRYRHRKPPSTGIVAPQM